MEFVTFTLHQNKIYIIESLSKGKLCYLGTLFCDLGCPGTSLDDWIFDDDQGLDISGNSTQLEKYGPFIYISDIYTEKGLNTSEDLSEKLKISRVDLMRIINEWNEKVCKRRPQSVTITHQNDIYTLTTSDEA